MNKPAIASHLATALLFNAGTAQADNDREIELVESSSKGVTK
ncbi:hypothetical protein [Marinobacter sp. 2_MG-2023]|nr:hypothetical protein [Marinobacter sp. 2_MG-2023]MDO6442278.1 hypothetical protein [Marinobacter sp. 2_MG-2023]